MSEVDTPVVEEPKPDVSIETPAAPVVEETPVEPGDIPVEFDPNAPEGNADTQG